MRYRRDSARRRGLIALCAALAVLAVGLGAWLTVSQMQLGRLRARIAELESGAARQNADASGAVDYDPNAIAAEFDGGVVTVGEAMDEYQMLASYYEMLGVDEVSYAEDAKMTVLSGLVERKILEQKVQELGLGELTDEERARIEAQAAESFEENVNYYTQFRIGEGMSEEEAREEAIAFLAENGQTLDGTVEEAVQNAAQQRLFNYVTSEMRVDDEQLRAFYDEQLANAELTYTEDFTEYEMDVESGRAVLWNPEGVRRVQSILIPFDTDQSVEYLSLSAEEDGSEDSAAELDALYAQLEPEAQRALERLNGGEDFEALMAEYGSSGPSDGSCVGARSTACGEAFRDAAMALEQVGDVSGVVRSPGGLCILRYASDVTPGAVPFEQVAGELRESYEEELKQSQYNAAVMQWIEEANPRYYTDRF